jgi:hypothetical protein
LNTINKQFEGEIRDLSEQAEEENTQDSEEDKHMYSLRSRQVVATLSTSFFCNGISFQTEFEKRKKSEKQKSLLWILLQFAHNK